MTEIVKLFGEALIALDTNHGSKEKKIYLVYIPWGPILREKVKVRGIGQSAAKLLSPSKDMEKVQRL